MAMIKINDIFDQLVDENKKLNECLKILIKFKSFIDLVSNRLRDNLDTDLVQTFDNLHKEADDVFKQNDIKFTINQTQNKSIEDIFKSFEIISEPNVEKVKTKSGKKRTKSKILSKRTSKPESIGRKEPKTEYLLDENQRYICTFVGCDQRLKHKNTLREHLKIHYGVPKQHRCDYEGCGFSTRIKYHLINHLNGHKGIKPYSCQYCSNTFSTKQNLNYHTNRIHNVLDQTLVCQFDNCHKEFRTEMAYKCHIKFHTNARSFVCEEPNCSFKTITASLLRQHAFNVHSNIRPHVCTFPNCPSAYKTAEELRRHMTRHSSEREYKCLFEGCGKAFKMRSCLLKHSKLHSGVEYECDWPGCEYKSKNKYGLNRHRVFHSSERNYACNWPECSKRFKSKKDLTTHLRIHNNDKRYACSWPGCQYRCSDSGNMVKHRKVHFKT